MAKIRSWEVSDEFWKRVEPFIPKREREPSKAFRRKPGGGRKPMSERRSVRGYRLCAQDGLPVEVIAQGAVRECKLGAQVLSAVAQNRALPRPSGVPVLPNTTRWRGSPGNGRASMEP
jgi:hypothetical protein